MIPLLFSYSGWAIAFLRIVLGVIFLAHGYPKMKSLKQTRENFQNMGFRPGKLWGSVAAFLEFFGGIALIFGIFTQAVTFLFAGEFLVIILWRSKKSPFVNGWELDLLILAAVIMLFFLGAGPYALDRLFL